MSNMTPKQQNLVKARKAARMAFAFFILGGAVVLLYGIFTAYLPTVLNGAVLFAASSLPFVVSKIAEIKGKSEMSVRKELLESCRNMFAIDNDTRKE